MSPPDPAPTRTAPGPTRGASAQRACGPGRRLSVFLPGQEPPLAWVPRRSPGCNRRTACADRGAANGACLAPSAPSPHR